MKVRDNVQWVQALSQPADPEHIVALDDLRALLVRGLGYALSSRGDVRPDDLEDFAQDALVKILAGLDSFRGESQFTTWALKVAVNVAFTELRRRRWQDVSLEDLTSEMEGDFTPRSWTDPSVGTEQQTVQQELIATLHKAIMDDLTEKQRQVLTAIKVWGMPLEEVASRMGTNHNALYKLLHDARQRLKRRLLERGLSVQEILAAFAD
ncbi:MAG: sigma-70 family RNA polymerase sigma factor [Anaerolineae bacterium]|nr:sigma-70 family RNA polymerase sigma factor [Anaerolineae bacterium]